MGSNRIRLLAAAVVLGAGLLGGCGSPEEKAQQYLSSAQKFMAEGDMAKADIELRNALKLDPQLAEAHYLRARVFESRKARAEMFRELQTVVQIDKEHLEANLLLARVQTAANKLDEAQEAIERARARAPDDPRIKQAQALLFMREQRIEEAVALARETLAAMPGDREAQVLLAGLLVQTRAYDEAEALVASAIATHPDADELHLVGFQNFSAQGRVDEAAAAMQKLIDLRPQNMSYRQGLALYYARNQRLAEAEAVLRKAVADLPAETSAKLALASFLAINDADQAAETLKGYIDAGSEGSGQLQLALAELYARGGDLDEAAEVYKAVSGQDDKTGALLARNQLARIAYKQGKADEAAAIVEEILKLDPGNADALVSRAGLHVANRETDAAIADLRQALEQDPDSLRAHVLLANAHLQNGATELAKASFVDALRRDPAAEEAAVPLASLLIRERRFDKALEVLGPVAAGKPSQRVQALQLQARLAMQDWAAADELAGKLGEQVDNPQYRPYIGALALQGQGKHEEAIRAFRDVLAAQPQMTGALAGIVRSYRELDRAADGVAEVERFVKEHPSDLGARQLLATEYLREGKSAEARAALEAGLAIDATWMTGYRGLGIVAARDGKPAEALAAYRRALEAKPDAIEFRMLVANTLERMDDRAAAEASYREVLAAAPASDVAANNLAVLLAGDGKDKARLDEAAALAERFANSAQPFFADTYAWILYMQGNHAKAAQILDRVVKAAPEEAVFRYHLGAAQYSLNDMAGAKMHLAKAEKLAAEGEKFEGYEDAMALLAKIR